MKSIATTTHAGKINEAHARCKSAASETLIHAFKAGALLTEIKEQLSHGDFLPWLTSNCADIAPRTAQMYMRLHSERKTIEANAQRAAHLSVRAATKLIEGATRDMIGNVLTDPMLIEVFTEGRKQVLLWIQVIDELKQQVINHPLAAQIDKQQFTAHLTNVRRGISAALPHAVCRFCDGKGMRCRGCKGAGWLNKQQHEQMPKQLTV